MYFLKNIEGKRIAFSELKFLFEHLEKEIIGKSKNFHLDSLKHNLPRLIGDDFTSSVKPFGVGFEDTRNKNASISKPPYVAEWNCWLATDNKYIVLDSFGRVVPSMLLAKRYEHRYCKLHKRKHPKRYYPCLQGTKWFKNWSKRYNDRYSGFPVSRTDLLAISSKDEFDMEVPLRSSHQLSVKSRNIQYEKRYRNTQRNWKSQSKKEKQWM